MNHSRFTRRAVLSTGAALSLGGIAVSRYAVAQTPEPAPDASPAASPEASPVPFPEGPLGIALAWLTDALNTEGGPTVEDVQAIFSPEFLATTPAETIATMIAEFGAMGGPWSIDTGTMITTMDFPATNAIFDIREPGGMVLRGAITVARDAGHISAFTLEHGDETTATPT